MTAAANRDDADLDVGGVALALAQADHPDQDPAPYVAHLAEIAAPFTDDTPSAMWLRRRLVDGLGYRGDSENYDDMRNADLMSVIDRRRGLPVALGLLYMHAARARGWQIHGLNFPGHFLLRLQLSEGVQVIDPFHDGRTLDVKAMKALLNQVAGREVPLQPTHMAAVPARQVLMRLQNNIRIRAEQAGDVPRASEILRRVLLFAPQEAMVWRDRAELEARAGNIRTAQDILDAGLAVVADGAPATMLQDCQAGLRRKLN